MPVHGTTDAIFNLRQLQEKHIVKHTQLYFAFIDLEKAFYRVSKVLCRAKRKVGAEKWVNWETQVIYENAKFKVRLNGKFSEEVSIKVGFHQGAVLSPLIFVI